MFSSVRKSFIMSLGKKSVANDITFPANPLYEQLTMIIGGKQKVVKES
jgi:hypothetical protein